MCLPKYDQSVCQWVGIMHNQGRSCGGNRVNPLHDPATIWVSWPGYQAASCRNTGSDTSLMHELCSHGTTRNTAVLVRFAPGLCMKILICSNFFTSLSKLLQPCVGCSVYYALRWRAGLLMMEEYSRTEGVKSD